MSQQKYSTEREKVSHRGANHPFFAKWGNTNVDQARRLVDICIEAGANLFDTANVYSTGQKVDFLFGSGSPG